MYCPSSFNKLINALQEVYNCESKYSRLEGENAELEVCLHKLQSHKCTNYEIFNLPVSDSFTILEYWS